ncbi:Na+/H+ antiporter family protein [Tessaracoccus antarcticus]|uniref:TRAP transporter large permease subunit n=1 Tax=Tessaracoccus antarcticus TaxID=2479848 RepID=A0A3M0GA22_9ACTN|nr:Na+/H+ antiporter NhaC family protein [Tessaracoccus antarcticus]RMB61248.1 TRAP transporter large permease subunit [Tessaracoccus antarcticus]
MNAVLIAVLVMLVLAVVRVHVVLALAAGAVVGGVVAGLGLDGTMVAFQEGLGAGAKIALSYALLGAFAMAVAHSGLPRLLADWIVGKLGDPDAPNQRAAEWAKWGIVAGVLAMAIMSQNLIPVHIAFIPLLVPPLLGVLTRLRIDRRLIACALTFGLVTSYMFLPIGFGRIYLNDILLGNIEKAGLDTGGVSVMHAMAIPALGMFAGLLVAIFISYRKPRDYSPTATIDADAPSPSRVSRYKIVVSLVAIVACFVIQAWMTAIGTEADPLLVGALVGLALFMTTGVVGWSEADRVFTGGMRMMAMIGLVMITAQGFASVMNATGDIETLVAQGSDMFGSNRSLAAIVMLVVGLVVTMGIGSSFSTLPIITAIYVPLCITLGFSPLATVAIIGTAGALGDAGSPASDSTLGPTAGLNADGQHDHIRGSVIPTFLHFNLPLLAAGWVAAQVL